MARASRLRPIGTPRSGSPARSGATRSRSRAARCSPCPGHPTPPLGGLLIGVPTQAAAGNTAHDVDCRIIEDTNSDRVVDDNDTERICSLEVDPDESDWWGADRLGAEYLEPGQSVLVSVGASFYDVQGLDCDGDELARVDDVDVQESATILLQ